MQCCCSVCLQEVAVGLVSPLVSYSKAALLWQHRTGGTQRGLLLALDQADLGPDITSITAASPLLAFCCTVQLTMSRLSAAVSSMQGGGDANLTEGWLTTPATVANRLIFFHVLLFPVSHLPEGFDCSINKLSCVSYVAQQLQFIISPLHTTQDHCCESDIVVVFHTHLLH